MQANHVHLFLDQHRLLGFLALLVAVLLTDATALSPSFTDGNLRCAN